MKEQKQSHHAQVICQVDRLRKIYSQIGEPLPVDVIIDLHRHLGGALEIAAASQAPRRRKKAGEMHA